MAAQIKTPGVYIDEVDGFPNSVVQVPTGIPVFIGHTEKAARGAENLTGTPTKVRSLMEFNRLFGGAPRTTVSLSGLTNPVVSFASARYLMYHGLRMFFDNGGSECWILSVGNYDTAPAVAALSKPLQQGEALEKESEPTMVCIPDAMQLPVNDWTTLSRLTIDHCAKMQSRVALLDIHNGWRPAREVISGPNGIWNKLDGEDLGFAAAYYPWVNTSVIPLSDVNLGAIDPGSITHLQEAIKGDVADPDNADEVAAAEHLADMLVEPGEEEDHDITPQTAHLTALTRSPTYRALIEKAREALNLLPPAAAMAGVYARTDANAGVFVAPANTGLTGVVSPAVAISSDEQADLNVPLNGKAINAIRTFQGRGVLVWGARTMDGNSQDWRYINVRRTMIMLEQSIKTAAEAYVFSPNTASTWATVKSTITNFLTNQWKEGALAGATPDEAFSVAIGLGETMTAQDILDGYMNVSIKVAIARPAEFIVLTFSQQMQTS